MDVDGSTKLELPPTADKVHNQGQELLKIEHDLAVLCLGHSII